MTYLIIQLTGSDAVVARFSLRGKTLSFLQGTRRSLPDTGELGELLNGFDQPERGEKIILSIPPAMVHSRQLSLPISDQRRLREILPLELAGETALPAEETIFDSLPLEGDSLLAVWCRRSDIAPLIDACAAAGLEPEMVTCSMLHWSHLLPRDTENPCVVTDGRAMMVGTSAGPLFVRALPSVQWERELSRTITAFEISRDTPVAGTLRIGDTDRDERILSPDPGLFDAFAGDSSAAIDLAGGYAVAAACVSGTLVNFRSGALAYTAGHAKILRRLRLTGVLAAVLILALFAEAGTRYFLARRDTASLDASIGTLYREVFPSRKKPVDAVGEVRSEIRRLNGGSAGQRILPILKKLSELKGDEVTGFYEAEIEGLQVQLKGDAKSVNDFKNRAAKVIPEAGLSEIKSKSDGTVSFVFRGTMKEGN